MLETLYIEGEPDLSYESRSDTKADLEVSDSQIEDLPKHQAKMQKTASQESQLIEAIAQQPELTPEDALKQSKPTTRQPAVKPLSEAKQLDKLASQDPNGMSKKEPVASYSLPDRGVLTQPQPKKGGYTEEELLSLSALLEQRLADFGVKKWC